MICLKEWFFGCNKLEKLKLENKTLQDELKRYKEAAARSQKDFNNLRIKLKDFRSNLLEFFNYSEHLSIETEELLDGFVKSIKKANQEIINILEIPNAKRSFLKHLYDITSMHLVLKQELFRLRKEEILNIQFLEQFMKETKNLINWKKEKDWRLNIKKMILRFKILIKSNERLKEELKK